MNKLLLNVKVEVWVYKGKWKRFRNKWQYRFFVGDMVGNIWMMGNKKHRFKYLFLRTKFIKQNPRITYSNPDMIYTFDTNES